MGVVFVRVSCFLSLALSLPALSMAQAGAPDYVLTLEGAVKLALINNLNLQASVDSVQGSHISESLAQSRFRLQITPSYARGIGQETVVDQRFGLEVSKLLPYGTTVTGRYNIDQASNNFGNYNNSNLSLGVTQPLLQGFGRKTTEYDLVNARRSLQSSERNLEVTRQRLAVDVVSNYFNIVRQQGLVDVAEKSLERNRELLRASQARLEVGLASKLDVFRVELQLSQAEGALILRKEALELALDSLKFNLGLSPVDQVALEIIEPEYEPVTVDLDTLTSQAIANRIEVREERDRIHDADRSLSLSRHNLLPALDLNLRYEQRGVVGSTYSSFVFPGSAFNAFLSTSYPLDRSSEKASFARGQIDSNAARRSLKLLEYNIVNQVRAAARNLERTGKSILLQERNIDFAEKQLRLATLRYQRGLASNFDIIDAENNLIQARSNYVSLVADHRVAQIELKRVTGMLDLESEFAPGNFLPSARHHP